VGNFYCYQQDQDITISLWKRSKIKLHFPREPKFHYDIRIKITASQQFSQNHGAAWYVSPPPFLLGDYWINSGVRAWAYGPKGNWAPCNFIIRSRNLAALPDRRCKFKIFCSVHFMCSKLFMAFQLHTCSLRAWYFIMEAFSGQVCHMGFLRRRSVMCVSIYSAACEEKIINPFTAHRHASALHRRKSTSS
jgi:hypothetical protein